MEIPLHFNVAGDLNRLWFEEGYKAAFVVVAPFPPAEFDVSAVSADMVNSAKPAACCTSIKLGTVARLLYRGLD